MLISRTVTQSQVSVLNPSFSLGEFKEVARILKTDLNEDDFLSLALDAAIDYAEEVTGKFLSRFIVADIYSSFEDSFYLHKGPFEQSSLSEISYTDSMGQPAVLTKNTDFFIDVQGSAVTVIPKDCWPEGSNVQLTYLVGMGTVPSGLKLAVYRLASFLDVTRNVSADKMPNHLRLLFNPYTTIKV